MAKEIVRELVNGEWETLVRDSGGGGGSVSEVTSDDNTVTVTNPTGPTVDLSVAGGSQSVRDLGVLHTPDLLDGPQTIYTPTTANEFFLLTYDPLTFVQADGDEPGLLIGQNVSINPDNWLMRTDPDVDHPQDAFHGGTSAPAYTGFSGSALAPILPTDDPVVAQLFLADHNGDPVIPITAAVVGWQANHAYAQNAVIVEGGVLYIAEAAGTSGGSLPTFTGAGDEVVDNDITWFGTATASTTGDIHLYALSASF